MTDATSAADLPGIAGESPDERYRYDLSVDELIARYGQLYTGAVYDVLDEMGLPNQALALEVKPLVRDTVLAGPAFTMKGIPDAGGSEELRLRRIEMFSAMKEVGVPLLDVRDTSADAQAAHYGEMNATVGRACGVIGAVVDGGCRDTRFLLERAFPVFCRYLLPVEAYGRWSYYDWQVPIGLRGALSSIVRVVPGDFLVGDIDGVVVIPHDLVTEVLAKTEELVALENEARAEFEAGSDPVAVYKRYGRL
jgi:regulator of RNase E activity RraA